MTLTESSSPEASGQPARSRKSRVPEVDLLKGWAILGVLFIHMSFVHRFGNNVLVAIGELQYLFGWAVIAFFFCAGFLFAHSSSVNEPILPYLRKRARRLLLPWIAFSIVYKILLLAGHRAHFIPTPVPIRMTDSIWRQMVEFLVWPGSPQLYFLPVLFVISVFCHYACHFRQEWILWLLAFGLTAGYAWLSPGPPHGNEAEKYPAYAATYLAGILVARPVFLAPIPRGRLFLTVTVFCFGALCLLCPTLLYLAVPLVAFRAQSLIAGPVASPLDFLGRHSGAIYVWHTPIIMPVLSMALARGPVENPWCLIPVLTAATILFSLGIARAVGTVDSYGVFSL